MKLAFVIYRYAPAAGGVERYVYNLAEQLLQRGHELHLFCAQATGVQQNLTVHIVPVNTLCAPMRDASFARNSERMLREGDFEIIHGFSRTVYQDIYRIGGGSHGRYLAATHRFADTVIGQTLWGLIPRNRVILGLEARRYRPGACRRLTAISELCQREIMDDFGVARESIQVIYNPVDTDRFNPVLAQRHRKEVRTYHGILGERPIALFVGTGFERKGLGSLITALGLLPKNRRPFLLVAGRDNPRSMRRRAVRCGVEQDVIFAGNVDPIESMYGAADYFVFPSVSDGFGQVVLEAMACGLAPIVSGLAGASEIITSEENGVVVENPRDVNALASCLEAMSDPSYRKKIGEAAQKTARRHTVEQNTEETLHLYRSVIEEKTGVKQIEASR